MKRPMNKIIAVFLTMALVAGVVVAGFAGDKKVYAKTAQISLELPDSVKKEMEFTVMLRLDSNVDLYSIDAYLSYDPEVLEFVTADSGVTGTDGVLEVKDSFAEKTKKADYEITFKALQTGKTEISLTEVFLIDYEDMDYIEVASSAKSFEVGLNKKEDNDARLSDLIVAPGDLTEAFSPEKTEYEMYVDSDIDIVGLSAIPMDEGSVVSLDMPDKLAIGENVISIRVTAMSGNEKTYTVRVYRADAS